MPWASWMTAQIMKAAARLNMAHPAACVMMNATPPLHRHWSMSTLIPQGDLTDARYCRSTAADGFLNSRLMRLYIQLVGECSARKPIQKTKEAHQVQASGQWEVDIEVAA